MVEPGFHHPAAAVISFVAPNSGGAKVPRRTTSSYEADIATIGSLSALPPIEP